MHLYLPLQDPLLTYDVCSNPFIVDYVCHFKRGDVVGLCHNLLKNEWEDMCRAAYTPAVGTDEPKIYGVVSAV